MGSQWDRNGISKGISKGTRYTAKPEVNGAKHRYTADSSYSGGTGKVIVCCLLARQG